MYRFAVVALLGAIALASANPHEPLALWKHTNPLDAMLGDSSGNAFIDGILKTLNKKLPARMNISDIGTLLNLKDCFIFGLDGGLHREGNATRTIANMTIFVNTGIRIGKIGAQCDWKFLLQDGIIGGSDETVAIHMAIAIPIVSTKTIKLQEFHMMELGDLDLILTGMGILDGPMEKLVHEIIDGPLKKVLVWALDKELPAIIQKVLDNIHI